MKYYYKNNLFIILNRTIPGFWNAQWQSGKVGVLGRLNEYSCIELANKYLQPRATDPYRSVATTLQRLAAPICAQVASPEHDDARRIDYD